MIACKSAAAVQLRAPQTALTPVVPELSKRVSRESVQKQFSSTVESLGGAHAPWTSKRGPHREAQAGRVENGTIGPSGDATAASDEVVGVVILKTRG